MRRIQVHLTVLANLKDGEDFEHWLRAGLDELGWEVETVSVVSEMDSRKQIPDGDPIPMSEFTLGERYGSADMYRDDG